MATYDYEKDLKEYMFKDGKLQAVQQGRYFVEWVLIRLFNRTLDEIEDNSLDGGVSIPDGPQDKGIDCCFKDTDTLYIIQCKYRQQHSYTEVNNFIGQMNQFFSREDGVGLNSKILEIWNFVHDADINHIKVFYITNNDLTTENQAYKYNELMQQFGDTYSNKLGKNISLNIYGMESFSKIRTGMLLELPAEIKQASPTLLLEKSFENRDGNTIVAEVALKSLARLVKDYHEYIFFSNIRNYKGLNKINQKISETYAQHPKDFWFYNNGITIVCTDYKLNGTYPNGSKNYKITAPQIVNGCQTASTIHNAWLASSEYDKNTIDGTILVKIIKDSKGTKRPFITKWTNTQTPVTGKDFFALEDFHKELQSNFENLGYYYEIQANARKNLSKKFKGNNKYSLLFDDKFKKNNAFVAKDVTQLYVSCILQQPGKAKNIGEYMPGGEKYGKAFNNTTPKDPRFYIIPYGIYYYFKNIYNFPDKKIDRDKWKASLLFISSIFFMVISKQYFNDSKDFLDSSFIDKCEEIIVEKDSFEKNCEIVKDVIVDFYKDSKIIEIIGDNLPKFLKTTIETNTEVKNILRQKIDGNID